MESVFNDMHVRSENVDSFSKLPNLRILEVLGASQPSKYLEPVVAEKKSSDSAACKIYS